MTRLIRGDFEAIRLMKKAITAETLTERFTRDYEGKLRYDVHARRWYRCRDGCWLPETMWNVMGDICESWCEAAAECDMPEAKRLLVRGIVPGKIVHDVEEAARYHSRLGIVRTV
jgi:hypothetical protein